MGAITAKEPHVHRNGHAPRAAVRCHRSDSHALDGSVRNSREVSMEGFMAKSLARRSKIPFLALAALLLTVAFDAALAEGCVVG
jgi:hypothetical protein